MIILEELKFIKNNIMTKLLINKKTRYRIYRLAYEKLRTNEFIYDEGKFGFCNMFYMCAKELKLTTEPIWFNIYYNIYNYPEIMKFVPSNITIPDKEFWFSKMKDEEEGKIKRFDILRQVLNYL
jgi:hypothetical protein